MNGLIARGVGRIKGSSREWWRVQGRQTHPYKGLEGRERAGPSCYWGTEKASSWGIRAVPQGIVAFKLYLSKWRPWTSRISNTWKPMRNSNSQILPHPTESDTRSPGGLWCTEIWEPLVLRSKVTHKTLAEGRDQGCGVNVSKSPLICPLFFQCLRLAKLTWKLVNKGTRDLIRRGHGVGQRGIH